MNYQIAVIPGDGIGPDVVEQTLNVMDKVGEKFGHTFNYTKVLAGGCAIDATGACLPQETIDICKASDAVLLGAVGGWKWDNLPGDQRPERALLGLRKALGLFANLRPALLFEQLADASPLKPEILAGGLDIVVVRELTGGIYFGEKGHRDTDLGPAAYDIEQYAEGEVRRIAKVAFDMAMKRSKHVTSVDKANVLESSRLWRRVVAEVAQDYPEVTLDNLFSQIAEGERKELDIVVKADVQGSAEAVKQSLEKLSTDEVRVKVIHAGVGAISKSDVMLANASGAIIIGFNVRPDPVAKADAEAQEVEMRMYRIIYDAIDDVKDAMKGMLAPKVREVELGRAEVRQTYKISNVGTVAGCYVLSGKIVRDAQIRVVRDGIVIAEDQIDSLKRFKNDAKEVAEGYECGVTLAKFSDIKEGDIFEAFKMEEYRED